jgi:hypothetical protein
MHEIIARNVNGLTRRRFLRRLAGFAALATAARYQDSSGAEEITGDALGQTLPRRPLGRTGEMVTMLGLGGFHVGILDDRGFFGTNRWDARPTGVSPLVPNRGRCRVSQV